MNILRYLSVYILCFFMCSIFLVQKGLAQGKVLIQELRVTNNHNETLPEYGAFLSDSVFIASVLDVLEKGIKSKLNGVQDISYFSGKQIDFLDLKTNPYLDTKKQFRDFWQQQKKYQLRFRKESRKNFDYFVRVNFSFEKPNFTNDRENIHLVTRIWIREKGEFKTFSGRTRVKFKVNTPAPPQNEFIDREITLYQSFPIEKVEIVQVFSSSLEKVFFDVPLERRQEVYRPVFNNYNLNLTSSKNYKMVVPTSYGFTTVKPFGPRIFNMPMFRGRSKFSNLLIGEQDNNKKSLVQIRERRTSGFTDMDIPSVYGTGYRRLSRTYRINSEIFPAPHRKYILKGIINDAYVLNMRIRDPFKDNFRLQLYDEKKNLKSELRIYDLGVGLLNDETVEESALGFNIGPVNASGNQTERNLRKALYQYGRLYTPLLKAEGTLVGKEFAMITNPQCINNVELYLDNELVGLILHSKLSRKQLRKRSNFVPHQLILAQDLTTEKEALIIQSFQMLKVGYGMNTLKRAGNRF
jgi:hypothetical protein